MSEISDILQIITLAFIRMKQVNENFKLQQSCVFVHQNVANCNAKDKMLPGTLKLVDCLDNITREAAEQENLTDCTTFADVIHFDYKKDVFYFPNLWISSPPMCVVNPEYSENVVQLKEFIFSDIAERRHSYFSLSQISEKIQNLWDAILSENFIYSYRNDIEVKAARKADSKYLEIRHCLETTTASFVRIVPRSLFCKCKTEDDLEKSKHEVIRQMNGKAQEKFTSLKSDWKNFTETDEMRDVLVQWQEQKIISLSRFKEHMLDNAIQEINKMADEVRLEIRQRILLTPQEEEDWKFNVNRFVSDCLDYPLDVDIKRLFESCWKNKFGRFFLEVKTDFKQIDQQIEKSVWKKFQNGLPNLKKEFENLRRTGFSEKVVSGRNALFGVIEENDIKSRYTRCATATELSNVNTVTLKIANDIFHVIDNILMNRKGGKFQSEEVEMIFDQFNSEFTRMENEAIERGITLTCYFKSMLVVYIWHYIEQFFKMNEEEYEKQFGIETKRKMYKEKLLNHFRMLVRDSWTSKIKTEEERRRENEEQEKRIRQLEEQHEKEIEIKKKQEEEKMMCKERELQEQMKLRQRALEEKKNRHKKEVEEVEKNMMREERELQEQHQLQQKELEDKKKRQEKELEELERKLKREDIDSQEQKKLKQKELEEKKKRQERELEELEAKMVREEIYFQEQNQLKQKELEEKKKRQEKELEETKKRGEEKMMREQRELKENIKLRQTALKEKKNLHEKELEELEGKLKREERDSQEQKKLMQKEFEEKIKRQEKELEETKKQEEEKIMHEEREFKAQKKRKEKELEEKKKQQEKELEGKNKELEELQKTKSRIEKNREDKSKLVQDQNTALLTMECIENRIHSHILKHVSEEVTSEILNSFKHLKYNLMRKVMIELVEDEDFNEFCSYIKNCSQYVRNYVESYTNKRVFSTEDPLYSKIAVNELNTIFEQLKQAFEEIGDMYIPDMQTWCTFLTDKLKIISLKDVESVKFTNVYDFKRFTTTLINEIDSRKEVLKQKFKSVTKHHQEWVKNKPYENIFNSLWGCRENCPFCNEPCQFSTEYHKFHSCLSHRPNGISGWRFTETKIVCTFNCNEAVASNKTFLCQKSTKQCEEHSSEEHSSEVSHEYSRYQTFKSDWKIESDDNLSSSKCWKWFFCTYIDDIVKEYNVKHPDIPSVWKQITKSDALSSLSG